MEIMARRSRPGDWLAVKELHHRARRKVPQLWWWEEHLARAPFIVIEDTGIAVGALFAWPDESPVAWVRLAALDDTLEINEWLVLALPPVVDRLRRKGTRTLAWMDYGGWAGPHLRAQGFEPLTEVVTLIKLDCVLPDIDVADVAVPALPYPALHQPLEGEVDVPLRQPHLQEGSCDELQHHGRPA